MTDLLGLGLFLLLGTWQVLRWYRGGVRLPLYVHWLAALSAAAGVLLDFMNRDLWRDRIVAYAMLPFVMPLLVYLAFGILGTAFGVFPDSIMRHRHSDDKDAS